MMLKLRVLCHMLFLKPFFRPFWIDPPVPFLLTAAVKIVLNYYSLGVLLAHQGSSGGEATLITEDQAALPSPSLVLDSFSSSCCLGSLVFGPSCFDGHPCYS